MILGSGLLTSSWPLASDWLVRDEFTDTRAAGSVNGTAATPGPGTRTATAGVSTDGSYALPPGGDYLAYGAVARSSGLATVVKYVQGATFYGTAGFSSGPSGSVNTHKVGVLATAVYVFDAATVTLSSDNTAAGDALRIACVLRSAGAMYLINRASSWRLEWITAITNTSTLYPAIDGKNTGANPRFDCLRVIQLPAPFDTDTGLATQVHSGSVAAGTTFVHEADCIIEATLTTRPTTGNADIIFRQQDANNYWICRVNSSGDISLQEVVSGTPTQRSIAAGVVSSGHRVVVIAEGSTIKGYSNDTLRWTYSSATNFATATAGELDSLGTGGAVSNLIAWPRTLSGTAAAILDKVSA